MCSYFGLCKFLLPLFFRSRLFCCFGCIYLSLSLICFHFLLNLSYSFSHVIFRTVFLLFIFSFIFLLTLFVLLRPIHVILGCLLLLLWLILLLFLLLNFLCFNSFWVLTLVCLILLCRLLQICNFTNFLESHLFLC